MEEESVRSKVCVVRCAELGSMRVVLKKYLRGMRAREPIEAKEDRAVIHARVRVEFCRPCEPRETTPGRIFLFS